MEIKIDNDKIVLYYIKVGYGKPLLLLHGNGEDHTIFSKLIEKLKLNFTVYAIDSRNHGNSTKTDNYSYKTMADDIFQFMEKLNLVKPIVVGFRDGAIISLMIALNNPNLFDKMVLLGVNLKPSDFKKENLNYLHQEYDKTQDPLIELMLKEPNIELNSLKKISMPTLVIAAEYELFKERLYHNIVETMSNAELKIMIGHEHDSYVAQSDIIYPILMNFLQE